MLVTVGLQTKQGRLFCVLHIGFSHVTSAIHRQWHWCIAAHGGSLRPEKRRLQTHLPAVLSYLEVFTA